MNELIFTMAIIYRYPNKFQNFVCIYTSNLRLRLKPLLPKGVGVAEWIVGVFWRRAPPPHTHTDLNRSMLAMYGECL